MKKLTIAVASIFILAGFALPQTSNTRIGDYYARAALRALLVTNHNGLDAERLSFLIDEADVEASTPAEEASLKEINRIMGNWFNHPSYDHQPCFLALKANLKARNGATPEACK